MAFTIYTSGVLRRIKNKYFTTDIEANYNFFEKEHIKVIIDTRSVTSYIKYNENSHYNPLNLHRNLKEKNIEYYNFGDLFRYLALNQKNQDENSIIEIRKEFYDQFSDIVNTLGTKYGNLCIIFGTINCFTNERSRLTWRGSYSMHMRSLSLDNNIQHFVAFKSDPTIFSNIELWNEAYGELTTIKQDIEDKKRTYYEDDYNSWGEDNSSGYSSQDLEDMYRDAFNDDPDAQWNID